MAKKHHPTALWMTGVKDSNVNQFHSRMNFEKVVQGQSFKVYTQMNYVYTQMNLR